MIAHVVLPFVGLNWKNKTKNECVIDFFFFFNVSVKMRELCFLLFETKAEYFCNSFLRKVLLEFWSKHRPVCHSQIC